LRRRRRQPERLNDLRMIALSWINFDPGHTPPEDSAKGLRAGEAVDR